MVSVRPLWRPRNCSQADYLKEQASKNFSNKQRGAWERAIFLRPSILEEDSSFLLMFLRGRRFHIPMAAQSILQFFDGKSKAFRDDLLTQRVTWQDLSSSEQQVVRNSASSYTLILDRERAGRAILYARIPAWQFADDPEGFARCIWYIPHSILRDDPDLQKRGVVIVSDMRGAWKASALQTMQYLHSVKYLTDNFVHHLVSTHMLYDDPTLDSLIRAIRAFQDKRDRRLRYRMHFGSSIEIGYSLRTYGIDLSDCLDLDRNFEDNDSCPLSRSTVEQKVRQQIQRDEAWRTKEAESSIVRLPKRNDVILGRGIHASTWPGTLLYYKIIAEEAHVYAAAGSSDEGDLGHDRHNKTMVVDGTIQRMQSQYHMRFLSRQETHWTIAPYLEIRAKVGSALRKEARFLATP